MTTKIENLTKTKRKLKITVPKDDLKKHLDTAFKKVGDQAKVPGFRQGKIPSQILKQHYGPDIDYECLNAVVSSSYMAALKEHDITPILDPKFDTQPIDHSKDYTYWVEVETKPKFELKPYKDIPLKKQEPNVTEALLNEELTRLQETLAQLTPVADEATLKDHLFATIDFEGTIDGKVFEGGKAKDYVFELGKGQLLKEFEEKMVGMKKGEERTIEITFPKDYFKKELASKKAQFKIVLKNINEKNLPKIDDEMAKDLGKKDLNEVKEELKKMIAARQERQFQKEYADAVKKHLLKEHKLDVPETLIEKEAESSKRDKKEIAEEYKMDFILEAIAKQENIQVTEQDLNQRLHLLAHMYRRPVEEIQKLFTAQDRLPGLLGQILLDKTMDFLIKNAKME